MGMTKPQQTATRLQMNSALEQAFDAGTVAAARCCLETALVCCRALAADGALLCDDRLTINETFAALRSRGWL